MGRSTTRLIVTTALSATILTAIRAALASEIGPNDFRISQMGPDGDPNFGADAPAIAYNPADQLFLVVWSGDDDTGPFLPMGSLYSDIRR